MNRINDAFGSEEEETIETSLRPKQFADYVGQNAIVDNLKIFAQAAKLRNEPLDHILLSGPPGLGKTTLAYILSHELGTRLHVTSGPALEKKGDLAGILTNLQHGDILFIDEIHRLNTLIEENLYPAMEEFRFDVVIGEGAHARSISLDVQPFTLVGATTKAGLLTSPLRDRFGFAARLEFYSHKHLHNILLRSSQVLGIELDSVGAMEIAIRSRGTPRIANRLLKRVRDFAQVLHDGKITPLIAKEALLRLGIDEIGLDQMDLRILQALCITFKGQPAGIETLSAALLESSNTIEDVYEPYLLQQGFIMRTPRGRLATNKAYEHLKLSLPETSQLAFQDVEYPTNDSLA